MSLKTQISLAAGLALLAASPSFAFSVGQAPVNSDGSSKIVDPDAAAEHMFSGLTTSNARVSSTPSHGAMVTYNLTGKQAASSKTDDPSYDIAAHPTDPRYNPFLPSGF
ncbi:MAG TPA: hypothetical protein VG960_03035 [Caulobacteraceae bacterium]|nr:hypothetical protein [Caulobacteraceae bacterium]